MEFGWINRFGAILVVLILIPNIVYAVKNKGEQNRCANRFMNCIEQIGRYGCIVWMWLPLLVWKFGFASVFEFLLYLAGNGLLLAAYWFVFLLYFKEKTEKRAMILAAAARTGYTPNIAARNLRLKQCYYSSQYQ